MTSLARGEHLERDNKLMLVILQVEHNSHSFINRIPSHRCHNSRRVAYRHWLLRRAPIPDDLMSNGTPERFAEMSLSRHKSTGTDDRVHFWYGAIRAFRSSVERIATGGVWLGFHDDIAAIIGRYPASMIPADAR
ncbi:hypothetical protein N7489_005711 [Penicillium chrysogenum]|nr:uncharacterized protein N7489_005711 [Penicillium chrysogenum]XP_061067476.1 uncharacterized protein N7525_010099 [Penicillium rubens]KAJ5035810.1 hypothetical protein NUH16_003670 [Penicillium rubens]KAJ5245615.1 hypothetical protein N7489_005711 [Penicillium chrysogenum]KAJ5820815.1 hypothetical protein N7525_010099 [Penicillium rubens]KAJ5858457.1 hypothetical protein N7534_003734 [Penicillium rubens]KAJ6156004.1 hypothetical protein N7497_004889 [Penicillium chrysogenum]